MHRYENLGQYQICYFSALAKHPQNPVLHHSDSHMTNQLLLLKHNGHQMETTVFNMGPVFVYRTDIRRDD